MRVVIKFHDDCKVDVLDWLAREPGRLEDRRRLIDNSLDGGGMRMNAGCDLRYFEREI